MLDPLTALALFAAFLILIVVFSLCRVSALADRVLDWPAIESQRDIEDLEQLCELEQLWRAS